jgi:NAD(P)-dependent dehydrogenase (short-subunit alcohol dehydrogenase family)
MEFKGKTAVVTGSSSGIGRAAAIALAKEGADIVLASRNVPNMEAAKEEIENLGQRAVVIQCDTTKNESVAAMKDKAIEAFGNIDILINNAGIGIRGLIEDTSLEDWDYIINTNLKGYIRNITAFLPHFMERGSGYIVNVSSIQALVYGSDNLNIAYIATKAGIVGLSDGLSGYLRPKGILVSCLIPGGVRTDIQHNSRYVGTAEQIKKMQDGEVEMLKSPVFLSAEQCAAGLLEGMKREEYLILTPPNMTEMLLPQGRDVAKLNAWVKNPKPFRMIDRKS